MSNDKMSVVPQESPVTSLVIPGPVFRGQEMAKALTEYKELQRALDSAMPDQLMKIGSGQNAKSFRKKGYWRAVAVAFNLSVEPTEEHREVSNMFEDGRENFGYNVTYRATAPNGRTAYGDGSCFAVEKAASFKCPHPKPGETYKTLHFPHERCPDYDPGHVWRHLPDQATEHNIRSHAHTRAFNRAVSNLVGFGEVSAEEVERDRRDYDDEDRDRRPQGRAQESRQAPSGSSQKTTAKLLSPSDVFAAANGLGWTTDRTKAFVEKEMGKPVNQLARGEECEKAIAKMREAGADVIEGEVIEGAPQA